MKTFINDLFSSHTGDLSIGGLLFGIGVIMIILFFCGS
jgi:hypothetical protein